MPVAQLSPTIAQQRAAQLHAVPCCRALLWGATLYSAALCFLSNAQYRVSYEVPGKRYDTDAHVCVLESSHSSLIVLPLRPLRVVCFSQIKCVLPA